MPLTRSVTSVKFALLAALFFAGSLPAVPPPLFPSDNSTVRSSTGWLFLEEPADPTQRTLYSAPITEFGYEENPHLFILDRQTGETLLPELPLLLNTGGDDLICSLRGLAAHPTTGKLYSMMDLGYYDSEYNEISCNYTL